MNVPESLLPIVEAEMPVTGSDRLALLDEIARRCEGMSVAEIVVHLAGVNTRRCRPPLPPEALRDVARDEHGWQQWADFSDLDALALVGPVLGPERPPSKPHLRARPLPDIQCQIVALAIDRPDKVARIIESRLHLAVTDPRLRPLLAFVADHAERGEPFTIDDALATVPMPSEGTDALGTKLDDESRGRLWAHHRQMVYQECMCGRYLGVDGLDGEIERLLHIAREDYLSAQIADLDEKIRHATAHGDTEALRDFTTRRLELRRRQAAERSRLREVDNG